VLLELAKDHQLEKFVQISTDEVYGSLGPEGKFTEATPVHPNSPYSASKAAADFLALSYHHSFGIPVVVTRCSNNYGPYQFPEKLIPLMIANALGGKQLPVYGDGMNVRDWIHVEDHCEAVDLVLRRGRNGEVYNIGGESERNNLEVVKLILKRLEKPETLVTFVKDRPGHDRRYAIDAAKIRGGLGWAPGETFESGLRKTVQWYLDHGDWIAGVQSGEYRKWIERNYAGR